MSNATNPMIHAHDVHKRFGALEVLKGVSLDIAKGEVVASGTADQLREQTGEDNLEDAFVKVIGSEEGLQA